MNKRGADPSFGGDESRYGGYNDGGAQGNDSDRATKATAAQLAKRKIISSRRLGARGRSTTPSAPTADTASFQPVNNNFSFAFGQSQQGPPSNGGASPSPAPFQFGNTAPASAISNAGQPNGGFSFGATSNTSFGSTFGTAPTQPSTNGFNPSNSISFGQAQPASTPSFSFGVSTPSQQNGIAAASTTSGIFGGFGQQKTADASQGSNGNIFKFASQSEKESTPSTSFTGFGQKSQEDTQKSAFGTSVFGQQPPKTDNIFGKLGQSIQPTGDASNGAGLFGSDTSGVSAVKPANPGASIFSGLQPKPTAPSDKPLFDSSMVYRGEDDDDASQQQTTTANGSTSNVFGGLSQAPLSNGAKPAEAAQPAAKPNPFFSFGQPQQNGQKAAAEPQSAPSNVFASSGVFNDSNKDSSSKPNGTSFGGFSSTPATSSATKDSTNMFAVKQTNGSTDSQADKPRSLFDRIEAPTEKTPSETSQKPTFSFGAPAQTPSTSASASLFKPSTTASTSLFSPATGATSTSLFAPAAPQSGNAPVSTSGTPALNLFAPSSVSQTPKAAPSSAELFKQTTTAGTLFKAPAQTAPAATCTPATFPAVGATASTAQKSSKGAFRELNTALLRRLNAGDLDSDWTALLKFYHTQAAKISEGSESSEKTSSSAANTFKPQHSSTPKPAPPANIFAPTSQTAPASQLFGTQTPKAAPAANLFAQPPNTAPAKKRVFEEDDDATAVMPATEKRQSFAESVSYPKLPDGASQTAKLFQATLENANSSSAATSKSTSASGFNPSTKPLFSFPPTNAPATPAVGFKPTLGASAAPATAAPAFGFKPTLAAPAASTDFLAAFGKAADSQTAKDDKKRKAEEYDSDEETSEQYDKRVQEEREQKRKKILEAQKTATGFVFKPSAAAPSNGASVFSFGEISATPTASAASTTPKAAAPTPGNFFGSSTTPSLFSKSAGPAPSAAPSTAAAAAASADDNEPSDTPSDPQLQDQSELLTAEKDNQDILFDLRPEKKAQVFKFEFAADTREEGKFKKGFAVKGIGKLYVLRDQTTGKTRVLLKQVPLGKIVMNFELLKGVEYKLGANRKCVIGTFFDHIHVLEKDDRGNEITVKPGIKQWMIRVADESVAKDLVAVLVKETPK